MKKFIILTLLLSVMFALFVFAVDIDRTTNISGYIMPVIDTEQPEIGVDCRDVLFRYQNVVHLINYIKSIKPVLSCVIVEYAETNHKGAAYLTDKTVFSTPNEKINKNRFTVTGII